MTEILKIVAGILTLGGFALMYVALFYRTDRALESGVRTRPGIRGVLLPWSAREYFKPTGYRLMLVGWFAFIVGLLGNSVMWLAIGAK